MVERPNPPNSGPETSRLLDQKELTIDQWKTIMTLVGEPTNGTAEKLVAFTRSIIAGNIPNRVEEYRKYLGRKHWNVVQFINATEIIDDPRKYLPFLKPRRKKVENTDILIITKIAKNHSSLSFTANDWLTIQASSPGFYELRENGEWVNEYETSFEYESWTKMDHDSGHYFPSAGAKLITITSKGWNKTLTDSSKIYKEFLLKEDEIVFETEEFPKRVTYIKLGELFIQFAEANPKEMRRRLIEATPSETHIHTSPFFGILEKPIP